MYRKFINEIDRRIISEALSVYAIGKNFTFKKMEGGFENASFYIKSDNKKYVLRIYNAIQYGVHTRDEGNILTELNLIEYFHKICIPVPNIHKTNNGKLFTTVAIGKDKHFAILTDYIEGKQAKVLNVKKIKNIAVIQAKMHLAALRYKPSVIRRVAGPLGVQKWIKSELKKYKPPQNRKSLTEEATQIISLLDSKINPEVIAKYPPILIHGDLHCRNLKFIGDNISGIFDFDDVKRSIVSDDIGTFLVEIFKTNNPEKLRSRASVYFKQYDQIRPIYEDEISLSIYFAARRRLIFKMLEFMGIWETGHMDTIKDFEGALSQVREVIKLAEDNIFLKKIRAN